mgnify:FL=1
MTKAPKPITTDLELIEACEQLKALNIKALKVWGEERKDEWRALINEMGPLINATNAYVQANLQLRAITINPNPEA